MVLGINLRKSSKRRDSKDNEGEAIRASPSLPELLPSSGGEMQWPANLVTEILPTDDNEPQSPTTNVNVTRSPSGKAPVRQRGMTNVSYHRPFRRGSEASDGTKDQNSIASIYASRSSAAFTRPGVTAPALPPGPVRSRKRTPHVVPTFNILVVGAAGTGKTSLIRLLLETCQVSTSATVPHLESVQTFMQGPLRPTETMQSASVEVEEGRERILLTVTDSPGLRGNELDRERSVTSIVRHLDSKFSETLNEESKVVRQSKGDQHVHLCIYLISPDSIKPLSSAPAITSSPEPVRPPSLKYLVQPVEVSSPANESEEEAQPTDEEAEETPAPAPSVEKGGEEGAAPTETQNPEKKGDDDAAEQVLSAPPMAITTSEDTPTPTPLPTSKYIPPLPPQMALPPWEIQVIKRLSARVNVLPVISHADTVTNGRLEEVKEAVRRSLKKEGLKSIFFDQSKPDEDEEDGEDDEGAAGEDSDEAEAERPARTVIRIKPTRPGSARRSLSHRSRSRTRAALTGEDDDPALAPIFRTPAMRQLFPFAIMSPDPVPSRPVVSASNGHAGVPNGHDMTRTTSYPPSSFPGASPPVASHSQYLLEQRGKYTRNYRWGSVDVLDPQHCDYLVLRHAILGSQMQMLKQTTNEVLYEKYRTEKLLVRRATQSLPDNARNQMLRGI